MVSSSFLREDIDTQTQFSRGYYSRHPCAAPYQTAAPGLGGALVDR